MIQQALLKTGLKQSDNLDFALILSLLAAAQIELQNMDVLSHELMNIVRHEEANRKSYYRRKHDTSSESRFPSWKLMIDDTLDYIFRRKFRMSKAQFNILCESIKQKVGTKEFSPESSNSNSRICGETKVAICLRLYAGGSYLEFLGAGSSHNIRSVKTVYDIFHKCTRWIDKCFDFPLKEILLKIKNGTADEKKKSIEKLLAISLEFSQDSRGVMKGVIGALDGLAVRIDCPKEVNDPSNYFCRKNFFALNAQGICDRRKRVLWLSGHHQGASHDSSAWMDTDIYEVLEDLEEDLAELGFFLVGDSAYPISRNLLIPYPEADTNSPEDAFNFWLSNSRIQIECAFGEIIMRWGIFWRKLKFPLAKSLVIIRTAAKLHNFLIDTRDDNEEEDAYFRNFSEATVNDLYDGVIDNHDEDSPYALVSDNNEPRPRGRPTMSDRERQQKGIAFRDTLCLSLSEDGLKRPYNNAMKTNAMGHVYFDETIASNYYSS